MHIVFFDKTLESFIQKLEKPTIAKFFRTLDLLERFGSQLGMPHSKKVDPGLFELRIRGQQEIRLLYTFHQNSIVILQGFVKKSKKIPLKELLTARHKMSQLDVI